MLINKKLSGDNLYFNKELTYSEDHEILLRLSLCGKIMYSKEPLIYYRSHANNMSRDYKLILKESEMIFELFKKSISQCNKTIVSIFVNKPQFNKKNDYKKYPRLLKKEHAFVRRV